MPNLGTLEQQMQSASRSCTTFSGDRRRFGADNAQLFGARANGVISLDNTTYQRLLIADKVTKAIDNVMDAGNQRNVIIATQGESFDRLVALRDLPRGDEHRSPFINRLYTGNCGEHRSLAEKMTAAINSQRLAEGSSAIPIVLAKAPNHRYENNYHVFLLYGDPRVVSQDKIAVVDPWTNRPSAHTLDRNRFKDDLAVRSSQMQKPANYLERAIMKKSTETFEIEDNGSVRSEFQRRRNCREIGNLLLQKNERTNVRNTIMLWDVDTAKITPKVEKYRFTGRSTFDISFDYNRPEIVQEYNHRKQQAESSRFPHANPANNIGIQR